MKEMQQYSSHHPLMLARYNLIAEQATPIRSWDKTAGTSKIPLNGLKFIVMSCGSRFMS